MNSALFLVNNLHCIDFATVLKTCVLGSPWSFTRLTYCATDVVVVTTAHAEIAELQEDFAMEGSVSGPYEAFPNHAALGRRHLTFIIVPPNPLKTTAPSEIAARLDRVFQIAEAAALRQGHMVVVLMRPGNDSTHEIFDSASFEHVWPTSKMQEPIERLIFAGTKGNCGRDEARRICDFMSTVLPDVFEIAIGM